MPERGNNQNLLGRPCQKCGVRWLDSAFINQQLSEKSGVEPPHSKPFNPKA